MAIDASSPNFEHRAPTSSPSPSAWVTPSNLGARAVTFALVAATLVLASAYGGPILLGIWLAHLLEGLFRRFSRLLGGQVRAAGAVTTLAFVTILLPLAGLGATLVSFLRTFVPRLREAVLHGSLRGLWEANKGALAPGRWTDILREHTTGIWSAAQAVMGASADALVTVAVILLSLYGTLLSEDSGRRLLTNQAGLPAPFVDRLIRAFHETGRGLMLGAGLTSLVQTFVATVAYLALGVPQAFVWGLVTGLASFLPMVGTALVWGPLAVGLYMDGQTLQAVILVATGVGIIGMIDNVMRPFLSRFAQLDLSYPVLILAMVCGGAFFGAWGLLFGPLIVRLTAAALDHGASEPATKHD